MEIETLVDMSEEELRKYVFSELTTRMNLYIRADEERIFRLVYYGTDSSGDKIIPWAKPPAA